MEGHKYPSTGKYSANTSDINVLNRIEFYRLIVTVSFGLSTSNSDCCPLYRGSNEIFFLDFVELLIPLCKGSKAIPERG